MNNLEPITAEQFAAMTPSERLRDLAEFLRTERVKSHFKYSSWVGDTWAGSPTLDCGTTACAGGWATVRYPWALRFDTYGEVVSTDGRLREGVSALAVELGLTEDMAAALFLPTVWSNELRRDAPEPRATADEVADWIEAHAKWLEEHNG